MRRVNRYALTAACFFLALSAWSEEAAEHQPKTLSVDEAVECALKTHVDVQRKSLSLNQSKREYAHAWNKFLPSVTASGTAAEQKAIDDANSGTKSLKGGADASLSLGAGTASKIALLKAQYEAGKMTFEDTVRNVECTVRKSYYELLYTKEKLSMAKTTLESYQRQYDQTKQKRDRGVVPELDLLSAQVNLESAKTDLESARSNYENGIRQFLNTIGMEYQSDVELTGSLDYAQKVSDIDESVLNGGVEKSSDVRSLENQIKTAKLTRDSTYYNTFFPSLNLSASAYPEDYSYNISSSTDSNSKYWSASIGISLPVDTWIPGSSAHDTVGELSDTVKDLELQLADKKKSVTTDNLQMLHDIHQSQTALKARELNVSLAQKSYEMTEEAYQRGTKDLLTLQNAIDTYQNAELELSAEQYNLISNVLDLENALALPAGTLFAKNNSSSSAAAAANGGN